MVRRGDRAGRTYTELGNYNPFKLHRISCAMQTEQVYIFEGHVFTCPAEYSRVVRESILAPRINAHANAIANLYVPHRVIFNAAARYIAANTGENHRSNRILCISMMEYIRERCGYPEQEGVREVDSFEFLEGEIDLWRSNGTLPVGERGDVLAWIVPIVQSVPRPARGCRDSWMLFAFAVRQFFTPDHPSKINFEDFGRWAGSIAFRIRFGTASVHLLQRLKARARTGIVDPRQIVAIFTSVGEDGGFSFFFVCSPHAANHSSHGRVLRLIRCITRAVHRAAIIGSVESFIEEADLTGFVPHDAIRFYYDCLQASMNIEGHFIQRRIRCITPPRHQLSLLRYIEPIFGTFNNGAGETHCNYTH